MEKNLEAADPTSVVSTPFMLQVTSPRRDEKHITTITGNAARESFTISVKSAEALSAGQRVTLYLKSTEALASALSPFTTPKIWTRLYDGWSHYS